jgi:hypothetical protein
MIFSGTNSVIVHEIVLIDPVIVIKTEMSNLPSSGMLNVKRLESQINLRFLGA